MAENGPYKGSRSLRALEFLEALISMDRPMSIFEIMRETGLPKATAHRLCSLLESEGFIAQEIGRKGLIFGHRTQELALGVMASGGVDAYRHQILYGSLARYWRDLQSDRSLRQSNTVCRPFGDGMAP